MNIVQIHERVYKLIDEVSTTRFETEDYDSFINGAIENLIRERYDRNRMLNKSDTIQLVQRVRDELAGLIKTNDTDTDLDFNAGNGNLIQVKSEISDYRYLLSIKVTIDSNDYNVLPGQYNEQNVNPNNPFRKVRKGSRPKLYYYEEGDNIRIEHAWNEGDITFAQIEYLSDPIPIYYGDKYYDTVVLPTGAMLSIRNETVYGGTTYKIGESFVSTTGVMSAGSGAVYGFINPQLPISMHEELCRRSAFDMLVSVGKTNEAKALMETIIAN